MGKILIVDDSDVMRNLLEEFLTDAGYEVESSSDGEDGLRKALAGQFDVCICDIHMPKLDGYELLCQIRKEKPDLLVVFTDSMPDQISEKIQRTGSYPLLRKPFELAQLREILRKVLRPVKSQ